MDIDLDGILLEVVIDACSVPSPGGYEIDSFCMASYTEAIEYLASRGRLIILHRYPDGRVVAGEKPGTDGAAWDRRSAFLPCGHSVTSLGNFGGTNPMGTCLQCAAQAEVSADDWPGRKGENEVLYSADPECEREDSEEQ